MSMFKVDVGRTKIIDQITMMDMEVVEIVMEAAAVVLMDFTVAMAMKVEPELEMETTGGSTYTILILSVVKHE